MKAIERFVKQIYLNIRTFLAYGKLRPSDFGHRRLHTDLMLLKAPKDSEARWYVREWLGR